MNAVFLQCFLNQDSIGISVAMYLEHLFGAWYIYNARYDCVGIKKYIQWQNKIRTQTKNMYLKQYNFIA